MELMVKSNVKYALACVTSMGVRITPADRMAVHNSNQFLMQATSAETNVLNVASSLGKPCLAMTRFVEGSPIAAFIRAQLRARNISFEGPEVPQGGPWGFRHQFNIADSGFGLRAPRVWNDRAGEVGRTIRPEDFDLARIFGVDRASIDGATAYESIPGWDSVNHLRLVMEAERAFGVKYPFERIPSLMTLNDFLA